MNIKLFQELAHIIDKDIIVEYGKCFEAEIDFKTIRIPKHIENDFEDALHPYLLIDLGFNYHLYCNDYVFKFLHELGHIVNGFIDVDVYSLEVYALKDLWDKGKTSEYKCISIYMNTVEEMYANMWAYDFIKSNRSYIKRLTKEIRNV